jgi:hypothetical protein
MTIKLRPYSCTHTIAPILQCPKYHHHCYGMLFSNNALDGSNNASAARRVGVCCSAKHPRCQTAIIDIFTIRMLVCSLIGVNAPNKTIFPTRSVGHREPIRGPGDVQKPIETVRAKVLLEAVSRALCRPRICQIYQTRLIGQHLYNPLLIFDAM